MKYALSLSLLLLIPSSFIFGQSFSESRMVPPDFDEIDYGKVVYKDIMNLTVDSPCGLSTSSASGGLWRRLDLNNFRATVTQEYRGLHRGNFNGTYTLCSDGGGGVAVEPTWSGSANAGKKLIAPLIADVMFIRSTDSVSRINAAVISCLISYQRTYIIPPTPATTAAIVAFIGVLYGSGNYEPPSLFPKESSFQNTFVLTKEYRMINKTSIRYDLNKEGKIDHSEYKWEEFINGFTPVLPYPTRPSPMGVPPFYSGYISGVAGTPARSFHQHDDEVFVMRENSTKIGVEGYVLLLIQGQIPYVWDKIIYTARANGTYEATVLASFFPTHKIYTSRKVIVDTLEPIDWREYTTVEQQDDRVGEFIYETGFENLIAPNALSPIMLSGQSTTF